MPAATEYLITSKFPDGNFSRPRLSIFAFAMQNKNILAASQMLGKAALFLHFVTLRGIEPRFKA